MPFIDESWLRKAFQALQQTVEVDDHTRGEMIQFLMDEGFWPADMKWDSALAKWNSCKNPHKGEFFKIGELWALMLRFHRHQLFLAMADDLGYQVVPIPTEAQRQAVLERLARSYERLENEAAIARAELARINTPAPAQRIPGLTNGNRPMFSYFDPDGKATPVERIGCP